MYRQGRERDVVGDCLVSHVRRIFKNPGTSSYTVVYAALDGKSLKIERDVTFTPDGKPGFLGDRPKTSFVLVTCGAPRLDESTLIERWIGRCPAALKNKQNIDLGDVTDLIVRADVK